MTSGVARSGTSSPKTKRVVYYARPLKPDLDSL